MRTTTDLQAYIAAHGILAEIVYPPFPTPTVPAAAEAMGVPTDAIIKSVLFVVGRTEPLLVIACGEQLIDKKAIAGRLGVGKKQVRTATPAEVLVWTGYPAGGVPPFGHPEPLPTWVDPAVLAQELVYGGGGDEHALLRLRPADLPAIIPQTVVVPVCG